MASCDYCGTAIIFGGIKDQDLRFCNEKCLQKGQILRLARQVPEDIVNQQAGQIHRGLCPKCQGNGPVDVHTSHWIYLADWGNISHVCCRSCGIKLQLRSMISSLFLGWWGIPHGFIMTPVQIVRNISGILKGPGDLASSDELKNVVRIGIASQTAQSQKV